MVATIHDTSSKPAGTSGGDDQWLSARDRWIVKPIEKLLYRLPYRKIVTDTAAVFAVLVERFGVPARRMVTVPCGIDLPAIAMAAPAAEVSDVLFVGRIVPHKHVDDFLRAVAIVGDRRLQRRLPRLKAAVIGDGPLAAEMHTLAETLGLLRAPRNGSETANAEVDWVGALPAHAAVVGRIKSARVLVLPSTREGFGLVLAEAMACGTPCVAYDVPAVRETLAEGEAGMLVEPRDIGGLAQAIETLLSDADFRDQLVATGRRRVEEHFAAPRFAQRMEAVYQGRLNER
jgi:glycosyltransferase involved in cell wall biosynthesis